MNDKINAGKLLLSMPWEDLLSLADSKAEDGKTDLEITESIIDEIDNFVDLEKIIDGPVGAILETIDGPIIKGIANLIASFAVDEEARKARRSRRAARKASRIERRDQRRELRLKRREMRHDSSKV